VWHELDTLGPQLSLATCDSYRKQQSHLELRHTYDFLTRLHAKFEPLHAQLLAHEPCVSLMEALAAVCNEESRLCSVGLLQSVLLSYGCSVCIFRNSWFVFECGLGLPPQQWPKCLRRSDCTPYSNNGPIEYPSSIVMTLYLCASLRTCSVWQGFQD
jgi:hypothetical protein